MAKKATKTATAVEPTKDQKVADISAQLNTLLNTNTKTEASASSDVPAKKNASRSNFKGELVIPNPAGGVLSVIPVKTYVATDEDKVERHMYHGTKIVKDANGQPVMVDEIVDGKATGNKVPKTEVCTGSLKQGAMACDCCGETVEKSKAEKGVEVGGKIVFISDAEVKAQQSMRDGKMKIIEYVDEAEINPVFYEDAEFVCPDGTAPVLTAFAMLVEGLKRTGKVAKGVRVKNGREQYFTLRPYGQHGMTMHYLRADYEVRSCDKWTPIAVDPKLVDLMATMIETTAVKFTAAPQDSFLANVRRLIKQKAAGVTVDVPKQDAEEVAAVDLMAALTQALDAANAKKAAAGTCN